jgi:hypothetical protein
VGFRLSGAGIEIGSDGERFAAAAAVAVLTVSAADVVAVI